MSTATIAPQATRKKHVSGKKRALTGTQYLLLVFFAAIIITPLYVVLVTSFKSPSEYSSLTAWSFPKEIFLGGWSAAWTALAPAMVRSLVLAVVAAVVSSFLGSMNGYAFSKLRFPGATVVFTLFLFGMFIPYQAILIPLQSLMIQVQSTAEWMTGIPTLIVVHVIYGIPICTLIFRNYYATVLPDEIIEAARVDGAGPMRIYRSIVLPLSPSAFVVTLIWQFTSAWNDFLFALFLTNRNTGPVTYALQELASAQNPDYARMMAGVLIASLPTLIVYIALGKYFVAGMMSGSVK